MPPSHGATQRDGLRTRLIEMQDSNNEQLAGPPRKKKQSICSRILRVLSCCFVCARVAIVLCERVCLCVCNGAGEVNVLVVEGLTSYCPASAYIHTYIQTYMPCTTERLPSIACFHARSEFCTHFQLFLSQTQWLNREPSVDYAGLDYEETEGEMEMIERRKLDMQHFRMLNLTRWSLMFVIGAVTACIGVAIDIGVERMSNLKFGWLGESISHCLENNCLLFSYMKWLLIDMGFVFVATILVNFVEPIAAGSGISEVKCYLNGIKMPHVVRLSTLITKAVGVVFSVSGGMIIGKEGPMIHSGAVVAAGISQGKSVSLAILRMGFDITCVG
jgi:hypothetical protein